ncbi:MAG: acetate/propionate family kinase [Gammaproteobacteria bacterium]
MPALLLIVNTGSTSIKTRLFDTTLQQRAALSADCSALPQAILKGRTWSGEMLDETIACASLEDCLRTLFARWHAQLANLPLKLLAAGHRIVHGGNGFKCLTLLDSSALQRLRQYDALAPLHNPNNRLGVAVAMETFPAVPQYGAFDTAFHRTMPEHARRYAISKTLADDLGLQRYGFHGIACRQALRKTAQFLDSTESALNIIVLHLGGGASATAIRGGLSVDTSMGFSPLEGLMMASRSGDIDPTLPLTLLQHGMSAGDVARLLNHNSGLAGICGDADMRVVLERAQNGDAAAELAIDMYCYRIKKYIGAYYAVLGKVDALLFSGGIGANAASIRARILDGLEPLGFVLDSAANERPFKDITDLAATRSAARILALHVNEEQEIAGQIFSRLNGETLETAPI